MARHLLFRSSFSMIELKHSTVTVFGLDARSPSACVVQIVLGATALDADFAPTEKECVIPLCLDRGDAMSVAEACRDAARGWWSAVRIHWRDLPRQRVIGFEVYEADKFGGSVLFGCVDAAGWLSSPCYAPLDSGEIASIADALEGWCDRLFGSDAAEAAQ
jgi:hypothetical protein